MHSQDSYLYHTSQAKEDFKHPPPMHEEIRLLCMATQTMTGKFGMFLILVYPLMEDRTGAGWLQSFRVYAVLAEAEDVETGTLVL